MFYVAVGVHLEHWAMLTSLSSFCCLLSKTKTYLLVKYLSLNLFHVKSLHILLYGCGGKDQGQPVFYPFIGNPSLLFFWSGCIYKTHYLFIYLKTCEDISGYESFLVIFTWNSLVNPFHSPQLPFFPSLFGKFSLILSSVIASLYIILDSFSET